MALVLSTPSLPRPGLRSVTAALLGAVLGSALVLAPAPASAATDLVGTLRLAPGSCTGGKATGTYFRMILPSGGQNGPYMANNDSRCSDQSYTPLSPGTDGGLRTGAYQPQPSPVFTSSGDARASRITAPATFYGTSFAIATNTVDPQTRTRVPAPRVSITGTSVTADLRSFGVSWNNQHFNQGAPKPDGSRPGNTRTATGTYDAATGALTLTWSSQIVGGPFDKFTGQWHFEGTFVPSAGSAPATGTNQPGTGGAASAPAAGSPGGGVAPGSAPSAGAAAPGAGKPAAAPAAATTTTLQAPPTVEVVTTERWDVSWPVVGLAVGIALLAVGALVLSNVLGRRAGS